MHAEPESKSKKTKNKQRPRRNEIKKEKPIHGKMYVKMIKKTSYKSGL